MLKLCRVTKVKVLFLVLVYVFNFNLFEFSAAILEKGLLQHTVIMFSCVGSLHFSYELFYILTNPQGGSKCKQRAKMHNDTTHRKTNEICYQISMIYRNNNKKKEKKYEKN